MQSRAVIYELRREISRLEGRGVTAQADTSAALLPSGFTEIDAHLPGGGLVRAGLHEVIGVRGVGHVSASGFSLHLLGQAARQDGFVLWCRRTWQPDGELYAPGVITAGFEGAETRLILVRCDSAEDVLWAMEEALATGTPAAVLGEPGKLPNKSRAQAVRRLQLAAESHGVSALLLLDKETAEASPACSRWRIAPAPGGRWLVDLLKYRNGRPARWSVPVPGLPGYLYDEQRTHVPHSSSAGTPDRGALVTVSADGSRTGSGRKTNAA